MIQGLHVVVGDFEGVQNMPHSGHRPLLHDMNGIISHAFDEGWLRRAFDVVTLCVSYGVE